MVPSGGTTSQIAVRPDWLQHRAAPGTGPGPALSPPGLRAGPG